VPTKRDNEVERLARIDALMEEYRVNHEDLEHYIERLHLDVREGRDRACDRVDASGKHMSGARRQLKNAKR
jgi:hypothetical protein